VARLERTIHEAVRVKPKPQWRSQGVGDARIIEPLLRKATDKWSQPRREVIGWGCPSLFEHTPCYIIYCTWTWSYRA
jgi:hypothetical protein